jgi:hypothetical protein
MRLCGDRARRAIPDLCGRRVSQRSVRDITSLALGFESSGRVAD